MPDSQLTAVLKVATTVPAPIRTPLEDLSQFEQRPSEDATISLRVCSEFTTYTASVSLFGGNSKIALVQDPNGQTVVFSVGDDKRLYCLRHENGANQGWRSYDITPGPTGSEVVIFDAQQSALSASEPSWVIVAAVVQDATGPQELHTIAVEMKKFNPVGLNWIHRPIIKAVGPCIFDSVSCGGVGNDGDTLIIAGTRANKDTVAVHYIIPSLPDGIDLQPTPPPEAYESILDIQPGKLSDAVGHGCYVLHRREDKSVGCTFDIFDNGLTVPINLDGLGEVVSLCCATTPDDGCTDLFIASEKGIAYFSHLTPKAAPQVLLPQVSVKQVVASECETTISIFAVSQQNELYFVQGTREEPRSVTIIWSYSGLPIRSDVTKVSTQYNIRAGSTELMYITGSSNKINHLWRSPDSTLWHESALHIVPVAGAPKRVVSYPAYVTTITVVNSKSNRSVGADYPCALASDWAYVTINDRTWMLTKQPVKVMTDSFGCLNIIQKVTDALASPAYELSLSLYGSVKVTIQPAQRVITQLARYTTPESIQNAKTSDGRAVSFGNTANFGAAAFVLGQLGSVLHTVDEKTAKELVPDATSFSSDQIIAFTQNENGDISKSTDNWFESAAHTVIDFIGDLWEATKAVLKAGFKFAIKVVSKVVSIVLSIEGKIFSFVISTVAGAIRSFAGFLKNTLGIDITGFLDWIGFIFDTKKLQETQAVMNRTVCAGLTFAQDVFSASQPLVEMIFESGRDLLKTIVPDHRFDDIPANSGEGDEEGFLSKNFGFILDNPIVRLLLKLNPTSWLKDQVNDIVGDDIKLPDLSGLFRILLDALATCFGKDIGVLGTLVEDIAGSFKAVISGKKSIWTALKEILGDTLWTLYDLVEVALKAILAVIPQIIGEIVKIIIDPIKLPVITDVWEAFFGNDVPMTLLSVLTLIPAFAANAYWEARHGKLPFAPDMMGDPTGLIPTKDAITELFARKTVSLFSNPPARNGNPQDLGRLLGQTNSAAAFSAFGSSATLLSTGLAGASMNSAASEAKDPPATGPSEPSRFWTAERLDSVVSCVSAWLAPINAWQDMLNATASSEPDSQLPFEFDPATGVFSSKQNYKPTPSQPWQVLAGCIMLIGAGTNFFVCIYDSNLRVSSLTIRVIGLVFQGTSFLMGFMTTQLAICGDIGAILQYGLAPVVDVLSNTTTPIPILGNLGNALTVRSAGGAIVSRASAKANPAFSDLALAASFGASLGTILLLNPDSEQEVNT